MGRVICKETKSAVNLPALFPTKISVSHPTVTSKMFDPTEDETAMSPFPALATSTLVIRSGTEVPAAKNVRPITYIIIK